MTASVRAGGDASGWIVVTGASSGIGRACAEHFAGRGSRLLLVARRASRLEALRDELGTRGAGEVVVDALDVRDRAAVDGWARTRQGLLAETDVLVNNAGLARGLAPLQEGDQDDWDEMLDTNVRGLLNVSRRVLPHLVARGRGHVVNVGSVAGRWVYPNGAVYCASKHAERAITEGMRMDLAGTGVRTTTVDPGLVETEFSLVRFHGDDGRAAAVYEGLEPLTARDVADVIGWVVDRPPHVSVAEVVVYPTDQASPTIVSRRT